MTDEAPLLTDRNGDAGTRTPTTPPVECRDPPIDSSNIREPPPTGCEKFCSFFAVLFYGACALSGQLMLDFNPNDDVEWRGCLCITGIPLALVFFSFNIGVLVFNCFAIFKCPYHECAYEAGPFQISALYYNISLNKEIEGETEEYIDMQKVVFTLATLSGSLSYLIMMFILYTHYSPFHTVYHDFKHSMHRKLKSLSSQYDDEAAYPPEIPRTRFVLNPFPFKQRDTTKYFKRTILHAPQMFYFYIIFLLNIMLFMANVGVLSRLLYVDNRHPLTNKDSKESHWNYIGMTALFGTQYCSIISCFIFSKVAYAVTIECSAMMKTFRDVCGAAGIPDGFKLKNLHIADNKFQRLSTTSMEPFRFWFTIHWFFYAVTAFASIAYLVETTISLIYGSLHETCHKDKTQCTLRITYVYLFTLEHTVLFLYPCFRAASILSARNTLIRNICNKDINIPGEKFVFIQYMKKRKCGFLLSIFCARIEFGFNVAYISIFLGLLGIVIKFAVF